MSKPFVICTGLPVRSIDRYSPQKYHMIGLHREYESFAAMYEGLFQIGKGPNKKELGYFIPGGLKTYAVASSKRTESDMRGRRVNGNVGDIHFVAFDFDDMHPDEAATILDTLYESGYESAWYATASSTPEKPKMRVLVALDGPASATTSNKAPLMIDIAADIWGAPALSVTGKIWYFLGVAFDKTAFREAQYMIRPHEHAEGEYFPGVPVDLDDLPTVYDDQLQWILPGVYGDNDWSDVDFDDASVTDWLEWANGRGLRIEGGQQIIVTCPNSSSHSRITDGTNTTVILLPTAANPEARFCCLHDNCDHINRSQRTTMEALGVPVGLLPDAHGAGRLDVARTGFKFNQPAHVQAMMKMLGK